VEVRLLERLLLQARALLVLVMSSLEMVDLLEFWHWLLLSLLQWELLLRQGDDDFTVENCIYFWKFVVIK
jgi:hypothetical protein